MTPPALVDTNTARTARVRRACSADAVQVATLVSDWAAEGLLLPRSLATIVATLDDYVVAVDAAGRVLACAAVREYAPSLAEIVSVAVARTAHGGGLGARVVAAAERLARVRGHVEVFAHTRNPEFFTAIGYECVDRGLYPEKRGRPQCTCVRREFRWTRTPLAALSDELLQAA